MMSVILLCSVLLALFNFGLLPSQAKMPFDANKLYCSEILAILLQNNDSKCVSVNCSWFSKVLLYLTYFCQHVYTDFFFCCVTTGSFHKLNFVFAI